MRLGKTADVVAGLDRQNGVCDLRADETAQQAADERERDIREDDKRARQGWEGEPPAGDRRRSTWSWRTHAQAPVVMTLRLIEPDQALR